MIAVAPTIVWPAGATIARDTRTVPPAPRPRPAVPIRPAARKDLPQILAIFRKVLAAGDTYALGADIPVAEAYEYWFGQGIESHVAEEDGRVVGVYRLLANHPGRGAHVANVSIMVDPDSRGKGVGLALTRHYLAEAKKAGFLAVQLNLVASTNTASLALARKVGFEVVGRLPKVFRHKIHGLVDAFVMHRLL
jgi:L-amino acid N-acyltransferase YncA